MSAAAEELAKLDAARTPGEWHAADRGIGYEVHHGEAGSCWEPTNKCCTINDEFRDTMLKSDAEYIAGCTRLVPLVLKQLADAEREVAALEAFWAWSRGELREGRQPDGCDVQDKAVELGLLVPVTMTAQCGEVCQCAEFGDFPMTCFRDNPALNEKDNQASAKD